MEKCWNRAVLSWLKMHLLMSCFPLAIQTFNNVVAFVLIKEASFNELLAPSHQRDNDEIYSMIGWIKFVGQSNWKTWRSIEQ